MDNTSGITSIYLGMLRKLLYFTAVAAAVIAAGLIIVFPVWFFAVNYPSVYSFSLVMLAVLFVLYSVSAKLYRKKLSAKSLAAVFFKFLYFIVILSGTGAAIVLFMNSLILQGSVIIIVLFLVSGILIRINRKQEK